MADDEPGRATNVLFDVWLVSRAANALLDEALEPAGLTADEFAVYSVLGRAPLTPTALAEWMAAPLTTVSSYVKRFETRGHVARVANPDDGRSYRVTLTAQGVLAHADAGARFLPVLHRVEQSLGSSSSVQDALAALREALGTARSASVADG
jgi:DNA-binding MarR family transcriptional regulator